MKDATWYAERVKERKISPFELVDQAIKKIERVNPSLNAVIHPRFEKAYAEARTFQNFDAPFSGIPILLKDMGQTLAGEPSTSGAKLLKDIISSTTNNYVKRLIDLGFIIVGQTNVPEFGFKNVSDSKLYGPVHNPKDLSRQAGGSSGGAAALVASGVVHLSPASDGGGSIRIPASFNGLIGLKPSRGRIVTGPNGWRGWQGASVNFALTKSVRDTKKLLMGLQDYQMASPFNLTPITKEDMDKPLDLFLKEDLKRPLKVAMCTDSPIGIVSQTAINGVEQVAHQLESFGHDIINLPELPFNGIEAMNDYYLMNGAETAAMMSQIEQGIGRSLTKDDMEPVSWAIYQYGKTITAAQYSNSLARWDQLAAQYDLFFDNYDLLLQPTTNDVAPLIDFPFQSKPILERCQNAEKLHEKQLARLVWNLFAKSLEYTPFTQQANIAGIPSISLPIYNDFQTNLPLGIQFSTRKGQDQLLLQVAERLMLQK
ncbi:amidase [Bavariicoccus seileri]|uniref:amidase n=1 Tax=Bavariicoccus seileri TaxID=549685 RepID=UPI003F8F91B4